MVINNNPCYAYLLNDNMLVDHKTVIAHVYAHCDFFENNTWFGRTDRRMIDDMANHATRIRRYGERHPTASRRNPRYVPCRSRTSSTRTPVFMLREARPPSLGRRRGRRGRRADGDRHPAKEYMDRYINPPAWPERPRARDRSRRKKPKPFPQRPMGDVAAVSAPKARPAGGLGGGRFDHPRGSLLLRPTVRRRS